MGTGPLGVICARGSIVLGFVNLDTTEKNEAQLTKISTMINGIQYI